MASGKGLLKPKVGAALTVVGVLVYAIGELVHTISYLKQLRVEGNESLKNIENDVKACDKRLKDARKELNDIISDYRQLANSDFGGERQDEFRSEMHKLITQFMKCKQEIKSASSELRSIKATLLRMIFKSKEVDEDEVAKLKERLDKVFDKLESVEREMDSGTEKGSSMAKEIYDSEVDRIKDELDRELDDERDNAEDDDERREIEDDRRLAHEDIEDERKAGHSRISKLFHRKKKDDDIEEAVEAWNMLTIAEKAFIESSLQDKFVFTEFEYAVFEAETLGLVSPVMAKMISDHVQESVKNIDNKLRQTKVAIYENCDNGKINEFERDVLLREIESKYW